MHDVLYPVYSFLQLYVIYKFGNVIVNKNKILARFAFMHCIGSSLCFWIYTIKNETLDSYIEKYFKHKREENCEGDHGEETLLSSIARTDPQPTCNSTDNSYVDVGSGIQCVIGKYMTNF